MRFALTLVLGVIAATLLMGFTSGSDSYYSVGTETQRERLDELLHTLEQNHNDPSRRALIVEQISATLVQAGAPERMRTFLSTQVEDNPEDPFNAYYLLLIAREYRDSSIPMALHYYRRILRNYADVRVHGTSVHHQALQALVEYSSDPSLRIDYYRDLLQRFPGQIEKGKTYYYLAKTHEKLGQWDQAFAAYKEFLTYPDTVIPEHPQAHREVQDMVDFYDSSKNWTMESLDSLVSAIKTALLRQSPQMLLRYKAKENFFAMSWQQDEYDFNSQVAFNLGIFLQRSRVHFAEDLEMNSNAREAYLRTWGWSYRIPTWYLYFRRVDFPANPEINGDWEWAGIYFGETL